MLVNKISAYIESNSLSLEELKEVKALLDKVDLPVDDSKLYAYEVTYIIEYNRMIRRIDKMIDSFRPGS